VLHIDLSSETLQVSDKIALVVLRIVQEGLTNVVRHATATRVDFAFSYQHVANVDWLELTLTERSGFIEV
jgi:two-component system sensor histidine kinase UhpB